MHWQFSGEFPTLPQAGASALKGSHNLADGQILVKAWHLLVKKDLLTDTTFVPIHLAGQYL